MMVEQRYRLCVAFAAMLLSIFGASAQEDRAFGEELPRTRLSPYATATAAAERGMAKQRYMQPIEAWSSEREGVLTANFTYPFSWVERQVFMRVERVGCPYEVLVNGHVAGRSTNGFAAAEYNITKLCVEDRNSVELRLLANASVAAVECFAHEAETPRAYIIAQPRVRVRDVAWRTDMGHGGVVNLSFSVVMQNLTLGNKSSRLYYELYANDTLRLGGGHRDVSLGMRGVDTMRFGAPVSDTLLWSAAAPQRLSLRLKNRVEGRDVEFYDIAVAPRELRYEGGRFYVNGETVDVVWMELSPCSTVADVAAAVAAGATALRFGAGDVADEVLEYCDARGVYVAITAPINSSLSGTSRRRGGNPSNNPAWLDEYLLRTTQMIHTTKRHPSVIAYFLADDSENGICLYESYLAAKAIAGDRPVMYSDGHGEWNSD